MDQLTKNYVGMLIDELFRNISYETIDLNNIPTLQKMGTIFSHVKDGINKRRTLFIISRLNEEQFSHVFDNIQDPQPSMLSSLLFNSPYIKKEKIFIVLNALNKTVSKNALMSKYRLGYRFSRMKVLSKFDHNLLYNLTPVARLKVLRVLAETTEYPFLEIVEKKELEASLFPLIFTYKKAIEIFIERWKW